MQLFLKLKKDLFGIGELKLSFDVAELSIENIRTTEDGDGYEAKSEMLIEGYVCHRILGL